MLNDPSTPAPELALQLLLEGNRRFRAGRGTRVAGSFRPELAWQPQRPIAIVLGCADARTPVEILLDQGPGDLFVVRVAGAIVAPSVVGSLEFAADQFGTRLIVVLGHTDCGAIKATVSSLAGEEHASENIRDITSRIAPHVAGVVGPVGDEAARAGMLLAAMRANVRASVDHLRHGSRLLEELVLAGRLAVVGAEYDLASGEVRLVDGGAGVASG